VSDTHFADNRLMGRTALIIVVPEAEEAVGGIRVDHDWSASRGVPAHLTVLFPFVTGDNVDEAALAELFAARQPFDFLLDEVETRAGMTWLVPKPAEPFVELTNLVWSRWPEHPPYEGAHSVVAPHLTVSESFTPVDLALPIAGRATEVILIEEQADGMWGRRAAFALGKG
jgi:2'-5' RNA ligase superfamily